MEFKLQTNEIKPLIVPEENEKEEWRVSICPKYMVSNFGRVKHIKRDYILTPHVNKGGYLVVYFYDEATKKSKTYFVHRLVALAFCDGYVPGKREITDHIDHCPYNNYYKNLRVVTPTENHKNRVSKERSFVINTTNEPVGLFNKDTNQLIKIYPSVKAAAKELDLSLGNICENIHRRRVPFQVGYFVLEKDFKDQI